MERYSSRFQRIGPKLHKNRRIYDKWGMRYHNKIQDIVFGKHCLPYVPTERPPSLSEEIVESGPLYVCKHCKDCFRFQSSFEDHNTRHSWILGFWCYICFETICTHITETGSTCTRCCICIHKSCDKRAYLRERGLHKSQRMGAVRVFYNQCQFVNHLKMHKLSSVNIADLMLIPLPVDMSNSDWCTEFEILCEALMERAFLLRTHIIDWLKMHNLQDNWWKLVNGKSNDNMINKIVDDYRGRELFETFDKPANMVINFSTSNAVRSNKSSPDIELIDNNSIDKNTDNYSANVISDKNILENDDNPCTPNDITFVDCGPASQCLEPEIPLHYEQKKQMTAQEMKNCPLTNTIRTNNKTTNKTVNDCNSLETNKDATTVKAGNNDSIKNFIKPSYKEFVKEYKAAQCCNKKTAKNNRSKLVTKTNVRKISDTPVNIGMSFPVKKSKITKSHLESLQTSSLNNNSNVLIQGNIQDPKNIASIISQLPSDFISNKKVVFIEQDSSNVIAHSKNEMTTKNDLISLIDNGGTDFNTSTQMCDTNNKKQELTGKIIVRNGKKYLIKSTKTITKDPKSSSNLLTMENVTKEITKQSTSEHCTSNPKLTPANSKKVENIGVEQTTSLYNNISLLTPSPSPSELSSSSSCDLHVKKNAIMPKLQELPAHLTSLSAKQLIPKCTSETISLIKEDNGELYMDIKVIDRITKESFREVCDVIVKYRREMFDEFYQMNGSELKERLDHLQCVVEEMKQVLNFQSSTIFNERLRGVNTLRCILEECIKKYDQDVQDKRNDDAVLNEWETKVNRLYKCISCNRYMKPKSYIPGFSKLLKNENAYCSCYKLVCHECRSHQGTVSRYIAHQNFHKKCEPYTCPDCNSKFNSITSLEIHTWTVCFHTAKKYVFSCKICDIDGFRDLESITRHFTVMHSKTKVGCENCFRVLSSYNEYVQHCTETHFSKQTHTEQKPIRLVICKLSNVILRCENYISYLEKYPGIRKVAWFKCPFCNLVTTDNKHVTTLLNNHIRENHVEPLSRVLSKKAFEIYVSTILKVRKNDMPQFLTTVPKDIANETPCTGTMLPRIVNTRTISSEIFERGSQETECMWSTNADEVIDKNPQTIDTEERRVLPKINVRSIDDLKSSKPKDSITKHSTETKKNTNSSSLQITIDTEEMELGNSKEETAKTEESEKDNNELTKTLCESEESLLIDTVDVNSLIASNKEFVSHFEVRKSKSYKFEEGSQKISNSTSEASTDSCIKIVDFMTICRPDIEPFVHTEMSNVQKKSNARYMVSFPKPPPLVRIPQHLLERIETIEPVNDSNKLNESYAQGMTNKSKVRIAIGTHTQKEGDIDYLCHLCDERINTSQLVVQAHFREKHSDEYRVAIITPQLSRMSLDFINGGYKQFINNKKRKSDSALFVAKRKRRWTPKKHIEVKDTNPPAGLCVEQETAEDGEGNFICKKCGQRCVDMPDLREHIAANHRLKGRYLICLECGENFVVAPSLQMHLKAFHGIEDPITYMNQNPSYAPDIDSDLQTEGRTTVANQCYVCMAVFEDKAAVDKHLRVHGMAFLNRKRIEARNALEKKTNTEEDKPNIIKDDSKEAAKQDKPTETILDKINAAI